MNADELKRSSQAIRVGINELASMLGMMKTSGGHLTTFGKAFIEACCANGRTHADIARVMGITRGAVSAYMRKIS